MKSCDFWQFNLIQCMPFVWGKNKHFVFIEGKKTTAYRSTRTRNWVIQNIAFNKQPPVRKKNVSVNYDAFETQLHCSHTLLHTLSQCTESKRPLFCQIKSPNLSVLLSSHQLLHETRLIFTCLHIHMNTQRWGSARLKTPFTSRTS